MLCGAILQKCDTYSIKWLVDQNDYVNEQKKKQNTLFNAILGILRHNGMIHNWNIQHNVDLYAMCEILHRYRYMNYLDRIKYPKF